VHDRMMFPFPGSSYAEKQARKRATQLRSPTLVDFFSPSPSPPQQEYVRTPTLVDSPHRRQQSQLQQQQQQQRPVSSEVVGDDSQHCLSPYGGGGCTGVVEPSMQDPRSGRSRCPPPPKRQLIIGTCTNWGSDTKRRALDAGMDFFLPKPFSQQKFIAILDNVDVASLP
jgi:hypothetical protein